MKNIFAVLVALILLAMTSCGSGSGGSSSSSDNTIKYSMSGTIHLGSNSGTAIYGANISIAGLTTTTDSSGRFTINNIPAGTYVLSISKSGYDSYTNSTYYIDSDQTELNFYLSVSVEQFVGIWKNADSNTGNITTIVIVQSGSTISVTTYGACQPYDCNWGTESVNIADLADGVFPITWNFNNAIITDQQLTMLSDGRLQSDTYTRFTDNSGRSDYSMTEYFTKSLHSISGKVRGAVVSGVTITLTGTTGSSSTTTDSSGNYSFSGAAKGNYTIRAFKDGYSFSPASRTITVSNDNVTGQDFTFDASPTFVWTEKTTVGSRNWTSIASSSDGKKLAAGVGNGYIYTSTDTGVTWIEQTSPGYRYWEAIASSADGSKLAAAASYGYIYTSTDSGVTWSEQTKSGNRRWWSITSSADGTKLAAVSWEWTSSPGYIYTSTDSGATWTARTEAGSRYWASIASSSDGTKLAACGIELSGTDGMYIYTSTDSGATWKEQTEAGKIHCYSIASSSDGTKLAAGDYYGYIWTSADAGVTWTEQTGSGSRYWAPIASSSDGTKLVAGDFAGAGSGGYIYTSTDSGVTWTEQTAAGSNGWKAIASSIDGTKLAAVAEDAYIWTALYNK